MPKHGLIGVQSQKLTRAGLEWMIAAKVASFRCINDAHNPPLLRELKAALPDCQIGLRLVGDVDLSRPYEEGRRWCEMLAPKLAEYPYEFVSGANETGYGADAERYGQFVANLAIHLRTISTVKYGAFDWGVCWPDINRLVDYHAGWSYADFIAMHGYKLPQNIDDNTIYHHRHVIAEADRVGLPECPIWLTEFGLDRHGNAGDGYLGQGWTPRQFADWLRQVVPTLTDVEHVILFLLEWTDPKWESWCVMHPEIQAAIRELNEKAGGSTMPTYQFAFADLARKLGAETVGEPLEQQGPDNYDGHGNVMLFTTKGIMYYNARVNMAHFLAGTFPKVQLPII